jgi:hypothetical protein
MIHSTENNVQFRKHQIHRKQECDRTAIWMIKAEMNA